MLKPGPEVSDENTAHPSKLRLFIGVGLPPDAAEALVATIGQPKKAHGIRWIDPLQWHVTLQFLGYVEPDKVDDVRLACAFGAGRIVPFGATFAGVGAFPSGRRARVVWVGVVVGGEHLAALATSIQAQTAKRGFELEGREYQAHLTIGRLRKPTRIEDILDEMQAGPVSVDVSKVTLFKSIPKAGGVHYEVVDEFPLQT